MKVYNLFPLLAGTFGRWRPHLDRAAAMGFDWVFVNPIQELGRSRSLYSVADYRRINRTFVDKNTDATPEDQVRAVTRAAGDLGLSMMADLVINHCAVDSPIVKAHPEWFVRDSRGRVAHPGCVTDGQRTVWRDLAQFDHKHSSDREGLYRLCRDAVSYLVGLGFRGFRCDAAYQVPADFWRRLIADTRRECPGAVFVAETLGCPPDQTRETAAAGFDYIFNSSKWWDFSSPWLLEQYQLTRETAPSISFPETHDTERLFGETGGNENAVRQRYLFAALFSAGVMMPMGYEYGFRRRPDVVKTRAEDWEEPAIDLTGFIARVNAIKSRYPVFQEESITEFLPHHNDTILLMWKASTRTRGEALVVLNKDVHGRQLFRTESLYAHVQSPPPLHDVSTDWPMDYLPAPFEFELHPGMARVLVSGPV